MVKGEPAGMSCGFDEDRRTLPGGKGLGDAAMSGKGILAWGVLKRG